MKQLVCSFFAIIILTSLSASAEGELKMYPKVRELKEKFGDFLVGEATTWKSSGISKNKIKLKNTYFSFDYDKCLEPVGRMGDDDPKKDPIVDLEVGTNCPKEVPSVDLYGTKYFGSIGITYDNSLDSIGFAGEYLYRQKVNLGGVEGKYTVTVTDDCTNDPIVCAPRVRMEVVRLCPNRAVSFKFTEEKGDLSIKRITDKNFELPQQYKDLILSFKCGKIPVFKK